MKIGTRFVGWVKDKVIDRLGLASDLEIGLVHEPPLDVSLRFKVTTAGGAILFVYGPNESAARARVLAPHVIVSIEPAGSCQDGVVRVPPEELKAAMDSMQDGRATS